MANTSILFTGATGYIGGSVLARLLQHPKRDTFDITIVIRAASKAKDFESFGLKVVIGTLEDLDVLERLASESDVVFQTADSDHLSVTNAILKGLKTRFEKTKVAPVLIHTSGTGALTDDAQGDFAGGIIYSDADPALIETIPDHRPHRHVDTTLVKADKEGYVRAYIVLPPTVWGLAQNAFTEKGLQKENSIQIPWVIATSVARGTPMLVGTGVSLWPHGHIEDTAELYYVLFDAIISGKNPEHGREGYYFIENGEYKLKQVCDAIAKSLYALGKADKDEPVDLSPEEREKYQWGILCIGSNSRARSEHSRSIGWTPKYNTDDLIAGIDAEVKYYLKTKAAKV